jgi:hypothetical protein
MASREISRSRLEERLILRAWEDEEFRRALLQNPRAMIASELAAEIGQPVELPAELRIHIHEETAGDIHFTLPQRPDDLAEDDQSLLVGWEKLLG